MFYLNIKNTWVLDFLVDTVLENALRPKGLVGEAEAAFIYKLHNGQGGNPLRYAGDAHLVPRLHSNALSAVCLAKALGIHNTPLVGNGHRQSHEFVLGTKVLKSLVGHCPSGVFAEGIADSGDFLGAFQRE